MLKENLEVMKTLQQQIQSLQGAGTTPAPVAMDTATPSMVTTTPVGAMVTASPGSGTLVTASPGPGTLVTATPAAIAMVITTPAPEVNQTGPTVQTGETNSAAAVTPTSSPSAMSVHKRAKVRLEHNRVQ